MANRRPRPRQSRRDAAQSRRRFLIGNRSMESILDTARRLAALGWPIAPMCAPTRDGACSAAWHGRCERIGKRPLMQGYPRLADEEPTARYVEEMLERLGR